MILTVDDVVVSENADKAAVAKAVRGMSHADETIVVLSQDDDTFIQAIALTTSEYVLEYRAGSADRHYSCEEPLDLEKILAAFTHYVDHDDRWRTERVWNKMDDVEPPNRGSVALSFDTVGLVLWPGIFGSLPTGIWFASLFLPLQYMRVEPPTNGPLATVLMVACTVVGMFVVLIGPGLTAGLVQRARQPLPARIEWDSDEIVEWNGTWARTTIPWSRLDVGWQKISFGRTSSSALQLRDRDNSALIHVWGLEPAGVPPVRRRIYAGREIESLVEAIKAHDPKFAEAQQSALAKNESDVMVGSPDWSRAAERWDPRWIVRVGRLGYVGAVVAPMLAIAPPEPSGISPVAIVVGVVAAISAALLMLRAQPVYREWSATARTLAKLPSGEPEALALVTKRKAVRAEMFLRSAFVVMTIWSTVASELFSRAHP